MFATKGLLEYADNRKEFILKKLLPIQIFQKYINNFKEIGQLFSSELREDNKPSCIIYYDTANNLKYIDYGDREPMDCFAYISKKYNVSFSNVLNMIIDDFGLKTTNSSLIAQKSSKNEIDWIKNSFKKSELSIETRPWEDYDIGYWGKYFLTPSELVKYDIYPVKHLWIDDKLVCGSTASNPCYCYKIGKYMKIYRPNNIEGKWYSNIPGNYIFGWSQKDFSKPIIILTKSLKDVVVYNKLGFTAVAPQAESILPTEAVMNELMFMYDHVLVNYDKDDTGIRFSNILCEKYGLKSFTTPYKDISDTLATAKITITNKWLNKKINEIIGITIK